MKKTNQTKKPQKRLTATRKTAARRKLTPVFKGMDGLAKSFTNVGIPNVVRTEISTDTGLSAQLFKGGNMPVRSGFGIKIKL